MEESAKPQVEYVSLIAKGAAVVFAGTISSGVLKYLFQVIVARNLGAEMFGLFSLGFAVFNVAATIAALGMGRGVVRFVSPYHERQDHERVKGTIYLAVAIALGGGIAVSLALVALSETLAVYAFHSQELTNVLRAFAIAIPFFSLTIIFLSATQALRIMKYKVYVNDLFEPLSRIVLASLAFLIGWQIWGATFAFVISTVAATLLAFLFYRKIFQPIIGRAVRSIFEPRKLIAYCWPLPFAIGFSFAEAWMSTFVLGYFANPREVGIFSAAYRTSLLIQGVLISFNTMFAPIISDLHHRDERSKLESLFKIVARWIFALSLPAGLLAIIFAQEIMDVFGGDFANGAAALVVLCLGQLIYAATGPLGVTIDMSGRSKLTLLNTVIHFSLQIGLCFLLIPGYGILGAALAKTISISLLRMIQLLQVYLTLRLHPFRIQFLKPVVAGGVSWLILDLSRMTILRTSGTIPAILLGSSIFLSIYGLILYLLGFDKEDRLILHKIRIRFTG